MDLDRERMTRAGAAPLHARADEYDGGGDVRSKDGKSSVGKGSGVTSSAVREAAEQTAQLAKEQAAQAAVLARAAAEKAAPKVGAAVEWASPRLERRLLAAGPKAEAAAEKVVPAVDAARDRIVDDLLPRLVDAVTAAAIASANAQRSAAEKVSASLENAGTAAVAPPAPRRRGRRFLLFGVLAAGAAAGVAAWRRTRAAGPRWDTLDADGPAFTGGPEPTPRTLTEPTSSASATVAETVTEEPIADAVPEVPATGDPVLDGLGTAEISGVDTAGASSTDAIPDTSGTGTGDTATQAASDALTADTTGDTSVDEGSAPTVGEGTTEDTAEGGKPSARRRKQ
jgi:hypothetical protein